MYDCVEISPVSCPVRRDIEEGEPPFFQISPTHFAKTWLLDPRAPKTEPPEAVAIMRSKGAARGASVLAPEDIATEAVAAETVAPENAAQARQAI